MIIYIRDVLKKDDNDLKIKNNDCSKKLIKMKFCTIKFFELLKNIITNCSKDYSE